MNALARPVAALVTGGLLGALGGWLWWLWWGPPQTGRVFDTADGPTWYPDPWDPGQAQIFSGTAEYALIGLGLGALLGIVVGLIARRREVAFIALALVAAALASGVMLLVGQALSPPDPQSRVDEVAIDPDTRRSEETLPGHLEVAGWTPYLLWPTGAVAGYLVVLLSASGLGDVRQREEDPSTWLTVDRSERSGQPSA